MPTTPFVFAIGSEKIIIRIDHPEEFIPVFMGIEIDDDQTNPPETTLAVVTDAAIVPSETTETGVPFSATFTITDGTYTYEDETGAIVSVVPEIEYRWYLDNVLISTGSTFGPLVEGDIGKELTLTVAATDPRTGEVLLFAAETDYVVTDEDAEVVPSDPDAPNSTTLTFRDSFWVDENGTETVNWNPGANDPWKPEMVLDVGYVPFAIRWTTSGSDTTNGEIAYSAINANHVETVTRLSTLGTAVTFTTSYLNAASEDFAVFYTQRDLTDTPRGQQFRVAIQSIDGGVWSDWSAPFTLQAPPPAVLPGAVTFTLAPASGDGRINISSVSGPTSWGDDTAGVREWNHPVDGWKTYVASDFPVTLPESQWGRTISIAMRAVGGTGAIGPETSNNVTVPGTPAVASGGWAPFPVMAQAAYNDQSTYYYPGGGFHRQYFHGGDASPVNPDYAAVVMDVHHVWVIPNATAQNPAMYTPGAKGIGCRNGVSVKFDPQIAKRFILAVTEGDSGNAATEGAVNTTAGLYLTEDLGETATQVLQCPMPGGAYGIYNGQYRAWRHMITYDRTNFNRWLFVASQNISNRNTSNTGAVYRSTNRGVTWSRVSTAPNNWGRCYGIQQAANGDFICVAENGLYRSTLAQAGSTWTRIPNPTGWNNNWTYTGLAVDPANNNNAYIVAYAQGVYKTEDNFASLHSSKRLVGPYCAVMAHPQNANKVWCISINQHESSIPDTQSRFSSNGLQSSTQINAAMTANGWDLDRSGYQNRKAPGQTSTRKEMMSGVVPILSGNDEDTLMHFQCKWMKSNGNGAYGAWAGVSADTMGSGEANWGNFIFHPTNPNYMMIGAFDEGFFETTNGGRGWVQAYRGNGGAGGNNGGQSGGYSVTGTNRFIGTAGDYTTDTTPVHRNGGSNFATRNLFINDRVQTGTDQNGNPIMKPRYTFASYSPAAGGGNFIATNHYVSTDNGDTWVDVRQRSGWPSGGYYSQICAMSSTSPGTLYAINASGAGVFSQSTNYGQSWGNTHNTGNGNLTGVGPKGFCLDPNDGDIMYYWGGSGVGLCRYNFRTDSRTTGLMPEIRGYSRMDRIRLDKVNPGVIYVWNRNNGDEQVWRSINGGVSSVNITGRLCRSQGNRSIEICPHTGILWKVGTSGAMWIEPPAIANDLARDRVALYKEIAFSPADLVT